MTGRITQRNTPMLEYGRKPYLITRETVPVDEHADYRYTMDTTWHKAQDDKYIVVQSVMKKPYRQQDYQLMENIGDGYGVEYPSYDFPLSAIEPINTQTVSFGGIKWIKYPSVASQSSNYTIIVQNSIKASTRYKNGKVDSAYNTYIPSTLWLEKATNNANGLSLTNIQFKGNTTWAVLLANAYSSGQYYIKASDGKKKILAKIQVKGEISISGVCCRSNMLYFLNFVKIDTGDFTKVSYAGSYTDLTGVYYENTANDFGWVYTQDADNYIDLHVIFNESFQNTTQYSGKSKGVAFDFYSQVNDVETAEGEAIRLLPTAKYCYVP